MTRQKQRAVKGVRIGKIPVSQGAMIPTLPNSSRAPSILRGATGLSDFKWPLSMCFCLLLLTFPKPAIKKKTERIPCITQSAVFKLFVYKKLMVEKPTSKILLKMNTMNRIFLNQAISTWFQLKL